MQYAGAVVGSMENIVRLLICGQLWEQGDLASINNS
jgi:hypothetical protein